MADGGPIERQDLITDEALKAPGIITEDFQKLLDKLDEVVKKSQEYSSVFTDSSSSTIKMKEATNGLTEENKLLVSTMDKIHTELIKQSDEYQQVNNMLIQAKQQTKEKTQLGDREAESVNRQNASIRELGAALNANRTAYSNLRSEQERQSTTGKELLKTIQDQDKAFKDLQNSIGKNQEKVGDYRGEMEGLIGKFGEAGEKGKEVFKAVGEAAASGWAVVTGAIALGTFAMKQFFERTEEGKLAYETFIEQSETRWDIFKNKIAAATAATIKFFEADKEYYDYKEKQRVATMTPEQLEQYNKLKEVDDQIKEIEKQKLEIQEEENGRMVTRLETLDQAAKLEIDARTIRADGQKDFQARYDAILKAGELYNEVQTKDIELATKKAGLANALIVLHKTDGELTADDHTQIEQNIAAVVQLQLEYDRGQKRRRSLEDNLHAEVMKQIEEEKKARENQYALYEKDEKDLRDLIIKTEAEKNNPPKSEKFEADPFVADYEKMLADEIKKGQKDWETYLNNKLEASKVYRKKEEELTKEQYRLEAELAHSTIGVIVNLVEGQYVVEEQAIQNSLTTLQTKYQQEIELAGDNADAKKAIDQRYNADQARLQAELVELKRRQAIFDKAAAVLDIGVKTAQAIAEIELRAAALATIPIVGEALAAKALASIPLAAGIGAVQIAAVLAKPLPSYAIGTQNHKGGLAVVHPNELLAMPGGGLQLSPTVPAIMDLPEHTKVFTSSETTRMLAMQGLELAGKSDRRQVDNRLVKEVQQTNQLLARKQSSFVADGLALIQVTETQKGMVQRIRHNVMM